MITVAQSDVNIDPRELRARLLGADDSDTLAIAAECERELRACAECFYTFAETAVKISDDEVELGFGPIKSKALSLNLSGCDKAFVAAVSIGHGVDRLLRRMSVISASRHFVTDAVASAFIEGLCDRVQSLLPKKTGVRFSPGYGDLPLSIQRPLLKFLGNTGISLTQSDLMIPSKSVTFIVGIKNETA